MLNVKSQNNRIKYVLVVLILLLIIVIGNELRQSLFFKNPERVNFAVYGKYPVVYSLGIKDKTNYKIMFYPDLKVQIPGGYGLYRVGAIGKLVKLEGVPSIFKKVFSSAVFSFIDFYFYPSGEEIYYGQNDKIEDKFKPLSFFSLKSNASFFDKVYLSMILYLRRKSDFNTLDLISDASSNKDEILSVDDLYKHNLGYLYKSLYRKEKRNIQIIYTKKYETAVNLSRIIEGSGIRVVDISVGKVDNMKDCKVIEGADRFSQTAIDLSAFFNCHLEKGKTDVSDIIFNLDSAEKDWEIN